jgi:hypothetical protein
MIHSAEQFRADPSLLGPGAQRYGEGGCLRRRTGPRRNHPP